MLKGQKCNFHAMPVLAVACLLVFTGCSSVEGTAENFWASTSEVTNMEQNEVKPENPPVHPGQPFLEFPDK
jgi:hypothetical protein